MLPKLHLTKNAFALHLLLQRPKRLINIVVTNQYLHLRHHLSKVSIFVGAAYIHRHISAVHSHRVAMGPIYNGSVMKTPHKTENEHISEARERLIEAALPHVVFDGWSIATLDAAIAESGGDAELARLAFPRGGIDMALAFHRRADRALAFAFEQNRLNSARPSIRPALPSVDSPSGRPRRRCTPPSMWSCLFYPKTSRAI